MRVHEGAEIGAAEVVVVVAVVVVPVRERRTAAVVDARRDLESVSRTAPVAERTLRTPPRADGHVPRFHAWNAACVRSPHTTVATTARVISAAEGNGMESRVRRAPYTPLSAYAGSRAGT